MIWKNIRRRKGRTLLTIASIAIGVAAMVALGALAAGMAAGYQSMAGGSKADFVLGQADAYDLTLSGVDERIGNELQMMPEVKEVAGMIMGSVAAEEGAKYFFIIGQEPDGFAVQHFRIIKGQGLDAHGVRGRPLLLGKVAADAMEVGVGDALHLTGGVFRIVGIYETGDAFEDGMAVIPLADAQTLVQKHRLVSAFYVQLKDTALSDRFQQRIERRFPDLELSTATEFGDKQEMVDYLEGMGTAVGLLAIIVGGVGMTNTVLMSVFERTREIGVLRAVGWRRRRVLSLILGESSLLALVGSALGTLLGVGLVYAIRDLPLYGYVMGQFSTELFVRAFVIAVLLGLVGGLYPAWRASQLLPLEAMRYSDGGGARRSGNHVTRWAFGGMTLKNLFRRKTRTVLTLLAIGIGIGAVVAMGGIFDGFMDQLTQMVGGSNAHLVAIEKDVNDFGYSAIDEQVGARLAAHPAVKHVSGVVFGFLTNVGDAPFFIIFGYHPQETGIAHFTIIEGERLTANRQVVLGRIAAESLGAGVGQTVRLGESAFRVVGIFETGTGWEEMGALVTRRDSQVLAGKPRQVSMYTVELNDPSQAEALVPVLEAEFPEIDLAVTAEFAESLPDMESGRAMMGSLAVLMALVGSLGMTNTILMSVLERTREIGVFRALGWSRRRILRLILQESLLLGGLGGLAGIGMGMLMTSGLAAIPSVGGFVEATFTPELMGQAVAVALVLGTLGGLYPAWRATQLSPVEALRYE
ncbi:MAG: ABC transporter permease [Ardenticatenaceae bacterium]|nr:ABC transporter permease [Ardenticatenaceae bacterium]